MCLESMSRIPSRAREDIVCYKIYVSKYQMSASPVTSDIYKKISEEGIKLYSPFRIYPIPNSNTLLSTELDTLENIDLNHTTDKTEYYSIIRGFHSFKDYEGAKNMLKYFLAMGYVGIIKKCIIPRNTKYYEGVFRHFNIYDSYCSESIILKETIDVE